MASERYIPAHRPRDAASIRAAIEADRVAISDALLTLQGELSHRLDWRRPVRMRPWAAVAAAFAVGLWLGRR